MPRGLGKRSTCSTSLCSAPSDTETLIGDRHVTEAWISDDAICAESPSWRTDTLANSEASDQDPLLPCAAGLSMRMDIDANEIGPSICRSMSPSPLITCKPKAAWLMWQFWTAACPKRQAQLTTRRTKKTIRIAANFILPDSPAHEQTYRTSSNRELAEAVHDQSSKRESSLLMFLRNGKYHHVTAFRPESE